METPKELLGRLEQLVRSAQCVLDDIEMVAATTKTTTWIKVMQDLVDCTRESHEEEMATSYHGNGTRCRHCRAIASGQEIIDEAWDKEGHKAWDRVWREAWDDTVDPERQVKDGSSSLKYEPIRTPAGVIKVRLEDLSI